MNVSFLHKQEIKKNLLRKFIKQEIQKIFTEDWDYASDEREYENSENIDTTKHIGSRCLGVVDMNGNEICEGYLIEHNDNVYLIKWSKNLNKFVARNDSKSWRDLEWIKNVSKYIKIIDNIHFNQELFNYWKKYL